MLVTICKTSQINYTQAAILGYRYATDFFAGNTSNSAILSWTGLHGNLTFEETVEFMYGRQLDNIQITPSTGNLTTKFLIPHGLCNVYEGKLGRSYEIMIKGMEQDDEYFAYISDPSTASGFQYPLTTGDQIKLSGISTKYVQWAHVNVAP